MTTMTIEKTVKMVKGDNYLSRPVRGGSTSEKVTMYGQDQEADKWFERWFPNAEKAEAYAAKRGWTVKIVTRHNGIIQPDETALQASA